MNLVEKILEVIIAIFERFKPMNKMCLFRIQFLEFLGPLFLLVLSKRIKSVYPDGQVMYTNVNFVQKLLDSSFYCLSITFIRRLCFVSHALLYVLPITRGSQKDVVFLGWSIVPSYMSPNAGRGVTANKCSKWSPNKLMRSNSIFNLRPTLSIRKFVTSFVLFNVYLLAKLFFV